ncbi:MAG: hypothetical protein ACC645_25355, partial [Pirellulales bacterium]
ATFDFDPDADPVELPIPVIPTNNGAGDGIQFSGTTFGLLPSLRLYAVGDRGLGRGDLIGPPRINNLLYQFDPSEFDGNGAALGTAISNGSRRSADDDFPATPFTDVVEVGRIKTSLDQFSAGSNVLESAAATVFQGDPVTLVGATTAIIEDGDRVVVTGPSGPVIFEFDSGPEIYVAFGSDIFVTDNMRFTLSDTTAGITSQSYKFETGPVIEFTLDSSSINDGDNFTLTDSSGNSITFEYDLGGGQQVPGSTLISVNEPGGLALSANAMTNLTVTAINGAPFGVNAQRTRNNASGGGRITLTGDDRSAGVTTSPAGFGGFIVHRTAPAGGERTIPVEETFDEGQVRRAVRDAFASDLDFTISMVGARINWPGADGGNFSQAGIIQTTVPGSGDPGDPLGSAGVPAGVTAIAFGVADTAAEIAQRITSAINADPSLGSVPITAVRSGVTIELTGSDFVPGVRNEDPPDPEKTFSPPFAVGGKAPGGKVTGLAVVDGTLFAVSSRGGLYRFPNLTAVSEENPLATDYVETAASLKGIEFAALAAGPVDLGYGSFLFGIDTSGELYAFDTKGTLQPIFVDGATSVQTDAGSPNGLAFSTLDKNLWHVSGQRDSDAGHGLDIPVTQSRGPRSDGGASFYFGNEDKTFAEGNKFGQETKLDYNYPGGAHGSLVTNTFSL